MASSSTPSAVPRRLEGKVAVITGGASGIGECAVRIFCQHGAKVLVADIQDDLGHSLCEELGPMVTSYVHCNVTKEADIQNAVDTAVAKYGKLDIMFNNAGSSDLLKESVVDNEKSDFEKTLSINVTGAFLGIKHAARVMIPARSGCIISTSSVSSVMGGGGTHAYVASKHALVGLTKNLAVELGQFGIRVNCVAPYLVSTPLTKKHFGADDEVIEKTMMACANLKGVVLKGEDIANGALYLASDDARYVSGHNLLIDGGFSIVNPAFTMVNMS